MSIIFLMSAIKQQTWNTEPTYDKIAIKIWEMHFYFNIHMKLNVIIFEHVNDEKISQHIVEHSIICMWFITPIMQMITANSHFELSHAIS